MINETRDSRRNDLDAPLHVRDLKDASRTLCGREAYDRRTGLGVMCSSNPDSAAIGCRTCQRVSILRRQER